MGSSRNFSIRAVSKFSIVANGEMGSSRNHNQIQDVYPRIVANGEMESSRNTTGETVAKAVIVANGEMGSSRNVLKSPPPQSPCNSPLFGRKIRPGQSLSREWLAAR